MIKILSSLSSSISQATDIEDALEKVRIMKSIDNISTEVLENLKQQVSENRILVESTDFINSLNSMLSKFKVPRIILFTQPKQEEWSDIPF